MVGLFNNQKIIEFTNKSTFSENIDDIHKVVLDGISDNIASLMQTVKYGKINTTDTKNGISCY